MEKLPLDRPMYMILQGRQAYVLLREADPVSHFGGLVRLDVADDGRLVNPGAPESTYGVVPCHLAVEGERVYVVNYLSGNIVLLPDTIRMHIGHGSNPQRQDAPHPHFVGFTPNGCEVLCTDLGLDAVIVYNRELQEQYRVQMPSGCGVRHLAFSADGQTLYTSNELDCSVSLLQKKVGKWTLIETCPALENTSAHDMAAAIRLHGNQLYLSIRGADQIVRFDVGYSHLQRRDTVPCGGISPRDFAFGGGHLWVANEQNHQVTAFALNEGYIKRANLTIDVAHPLCVVIT